jgi:hypothetical protein
MSRPELIHSLEGLRANAENQDELVFLGVAQPERGACVPLGKALVRRRALQSAVSPASSVLLRHGQGVVGPILVDCP